MVGGNSGDACGWIVWNDTSVSDSWSEFVLLSGWLCLSTSSSCNVEGCALGEYLDLGILDYWWPLWIKIVAIWFKHFEILWYKCGLSNCQFWPVSLCMGLCQGLWVTSKIYKSKTGLTMQAICKTWQIDLSLIIPVMQYFELQVFQFFLVLWLGAQVKIQVKSSVHCSQWWTSSKQAGKYFQKL